MHKIPAYIGIDVGSVSTGLVLISSAADVLHTLYLRTEGKPIPAVQQAVRTTAQALSGEVEILGVGATGSGRHLSATMLGADLIKNEITAHAVAAMHFHPDVRTVLEIGGQDSKIIILKDGIVVDFAMNTVCAAGTGSFLDQQAARLRIPIEAFGHYALRSDKPVRIAGRCGVFAESDMIHKQHLGHRTEDIIAGLCEALVRNYLTNLGKAKDIRPPIIFQGGVAANVGVRAAFEKALGCEVTVPPQFGTMGALGAALLAKNHVQSNGRPTRFKGWQVAEVGYRTTSLDCQDCSNLCEVVEFHEGDRLLTRWGDRCGKWGAG